MPVTSTRALPAEARRSLWIYNCLFPFAFVLLLPGLLSRMFRRGGFREDFGQRFGRYSPELSARFDEGRWIWVHSISVGETLLALKLVQEILRQDADVRVVLSVTTTTGYAQARQAASDRLVAIYNPVDARWIVPRALRTIRPERLVFIEAMWPNLLSQAYRAGVSITMVPRLSPRSERRFRKFRWLAGPIFRLIGRFFVQDQRDGDRWMANGVRPEQVEITGNIKYDPPAESQPNLEPLRAVLQEHGVDERRPILLGGSTFPGEEAILGRTLLALRQRIPNLFLIVVPRHVERSGDAEVDLIKLAVKVARRKGAPVTGADCLLVDTTGELRDWYYLATVVFIGKSLTAEGGQNPVEAVLARKPVVYGPNMQNFQAVADAWREADAAVQIRGEQELTKAVEHLLLDPEQRAALVDRATKFTEAHRESTRRIAQRILEI